MGAMKDLYTNGVYDLVSYDAGKQDGRREKSDEIIQMISKALDNPALELEAMPVRLALTVMIGAITAVAQDELKENNGKTN